MKFSAELHQQVMILKVTPYFIAFFNVKSGIPLDSSVPRDHIVEQMTPITSWGTRFIVTPTPDATIMDFFGLVAAEDDTEVDIEGETVCETIDFKYSIYIYLTPAYKVRPLYRKGSSKHIIFGFSTLQAAASILTKFERSFHAKA